ncbi:hypothetical protein BO99DRAFT_431742 [Aspergillus violaceofuscus CBS 115571]|uniref:Uncharacterized protein n=1 Tax=Aspergillus violaceofuscus (strain CBS 115571) TaxID=1450538 RepID=A0A2V5HG43_ASPV1|nr:hypothetical protein BO99DRAFT_431742 [Aspergillus violaceofuscus CBS 115571]
MSQPTTAILLQLPDELDLHYAVQDEAKKIIKHVRADALTYDHYWRGVRVPKDHPAILAHSQHCPQRLEHSLKEGKGEEIRRFLEAGLMPTVRTRFYYDEPLLHSFMLYRKFFQDDITILRLLLENGAQPNAMGLAGRTALDAGLTLNPSPFYTEWLELTLAYGGVARNYKVLAMLYKAGSVHGRGDRDNDGNGLRNGSRLVRKVIANGMDVVREVHGFGNLLLDDGWSWPTRLVFSTEQVCDLVGLVLELLDLDDNTGYTATDYIMKYRPAVARSLEQTKHPRFGEVQDTWITRQGGKRYCQILNAPGLWEYLVSLEAIEPDLQSLQEEAVQLSFDYIMEYKPAVALYMEVINHPRIDDLANTWIMERGREIYQEALDRHPSSTDDLHIFYVRR